MTTDLVSNRNGFFSLPVNNCWSCPSCSFHNPLISYPRCSMCNSATAHISLDLHIAELSPLAWECSRCTLNNNIDDERCAACGQARQKPVICPFPIPEQTRSALMQKPEVIVLFNSMLPASQTSMSLAVRDRHHKDESNAENMFQHIITYCEQADTHFVDDGFIPSASSIGSDAFEDISQWLRIADVAPVSDKDRTLPLTIFSSPQPSDIQQGALGNCWLVAALALVSEQPRLLEHILLTKTVNEQGVYLVRICHNGLWKTIIVDDCFPCTKHRRLVFSQAKRRQLYVPLIEKACAKVFGSYASLRSGNMREGLQLLTGAPCDHIDLHPNHDPLDGDLVWAKLLSACESKLLIGVSSGVANVTREEYNLVHIHGNHAFSLLAAHAFDKDSSRFVLVRDPHARSQYTEDAVTEGVLQQLRQVNGAHRSTGAFWISWSRFLRYFSSITISTYNSNQFDVREAGKFNTSSTDDVTSYRFHVPQTSMINISLLYHRHNRTTPVSHTQSFVLCDVDDGESFNSIGIRESIFVCKRGGLTHWSGSLRAGSYVLIPFSFSFWGAAAANRDYTLVIHSNMQLGMSIENKPATFLTDSLISAMMKSAERKQEREAVFYKTSGRLGMKIFVVENISVTNHLTVDVDIGAAKNVRHSRHRCLPYNTHDCIPPRHRQLIFITEWTEKSSGSTYLSYSYSYKHDLDITETLPAIDRTGHDLHSPRAF